MNFTFFHGWAALAVTGLLSLSATAADPTDAYDPLQPLIVTATRQPTLADDLVLPVIVIDRAQIERSLADDLAQLLRFAAGIDIGRNGGPGQTTSTFIRGAESNHTLVLIDGVRINPGTLGLPAIQNIRPELIERIEIIKGNRSSLYGSDAIGGVINVITRRDTRDAAFEIGLGGGRYGTREATASLSARNDTTSVDLNVAYTKTDGFPTRSGTTTNRGYENVNVNLGASALLGRSTLSARYFQAEGNAEYLGFFGDLLDQDFRNAVAALTLDVPVNDTWSSRLDVSLATDDIEQGQSADLTKTDRLTFDWQNTLRLGLDHTLVAGAFVTNEDTDSLIFGAGFDESTDVVAVYVEDNFQRGAHTASVAGRYTDHDSFGGEATWHFDYGYALTESLGLYGAVSRGFRAPDATDRFGFGGNPDLAPEVSNNVEAGLDWRPAAGQQVQLSVFSLDIDDLILFDFDPVSLTGENQNIARARIQGLEARYTLRASNWGLQAGAVIQDPNNEVTDGVLPRRSRRSLTLNAYRQVRNVELGLDVLLSGRRKDSDFSDAYNAGYMLTNISARVPLASGFELRAKIENLLDTDYETALGFATPGRGLHVDLYYRGR